MRSDIDREALWAPLADSSESPLDHPRDWIGNSWPRESFPNSLPLGWAGPTLPYGSDGFRAGETEWLGFAIAAHFAAADDRVPTVVELGASQAPWCLSWIRAMRRLGVNKKVVAVAYEAGDGRAATERFWAQQDLSYVASVTEEGCLRCEAPGWTFEWWQRAVVSGGGTVRFPAVDITKDNGAQATRLPGDIDYRGRELPFNEVGAIDPVDVLLAVGFAHFVHLDIQGAEEQVLRDGRFRELAQRLAVVQLGTHSRTAEGLAFDELAAAGLVLIDEDPCEYLVVGNRPTLYRDGEQLWVSPDVVAFLEQRSYLTA